MLYKLLIKMSLFLLSRQANDFLVLFIILIYKKKPPLERWCLGHYIGSTFRTHEEFFSQKLGKKKKCVPSQLQLTRTEKPGPGPLAVALGGPVFLGPMHPLEPF